MANKHINDLLKYGTIIWKHPAMDAASQGGYTVTGPGLTESANMGIPYNEYYKVIGRKNSGTTSCCIKRGWGFTATFPSGVKLKKITLHNGYYSANSANYVSSFTVTINGSTSLGSFTPTQSQLTTSVFNITNATTIHSITISFDGSYYASVQGIEFEGLGYF